MLISKIRGRGEKISVRQAISVLQIYPLPLHIPFRRWSAWHPQHSLGNEAIGLGHGYRQNPLSVRSDTP